MLRSNFEGREEVLVPGANLTTPNEEFDRRDIEIISCIAKEQAYLANRDLEEEQSKCGVLRFNRAGVEITDLTGYNVAQPIQDGGLDAEGNPYYLLGVRMERLDDEAESKVEYFWASSPFSDDWELIEEGLPVIAGQDPRVAVINAHADNGGVLKPKEIVLNVVETALDDELGVDESKLIYWTRFYRGKTFRELLPFAKGPRKMKDICLVQMPSTNKIITFTRPQSEIEKPEPGGLGQIGEVTIEVIDQINELLLQNAELINTRFQSDEWGGINYAVPLMEDKVGVIGHIARRDNSDLAIKVEDRPKIYHSFSAVYNPQTRKLTDIRILAMADEFRMPDGSEIKPKTPLLKQVAFGSAITEPDENGKVRLLLGVGDAVTGRKIIDDPFAGLRIPVEQLQVAA